jgi:hypothetical protein
MNNSSLPPDLGDGLEPAREADRAATAAEGSEASRAADTAHAAEPARPASASEDPRAAGLPTSLKPRRRMWPLALTGLAAALLIGDLRRNPRKFRRSTL